MRKGMWKETEKRLSSILLAGMILTTTVATPVFAVHTYYWPDAISADAMEIKNWTWKAEGEAAALAPSVGLIPTGLSQQETALMGGYTSHPAKPDAVHLHVLPDILQQLRKTAVHT